MKRVINFVLIFVLSLTTLMTIYQPKAEAAFNQNLIIGDAAFNNSTSMSAAQIDAFLNGFPNSCISTNSGFAAILPTGYSPSSGFSYGGYATAGEVIAQSAQVYGLNPKALLVTLQKEQSLVAGGANFCNNGDNNKYAAAVGYGCPDSGTVHSYSGISLYRRNGVVVSTTGSTCVNTAEKAGFSQQVIRGAWLLKFGQQRSLGNTGWAVITGSWDNSDDPPTCYGGPMTQGTFKRCQSGSAAFFDGYTTIDGVAVHMNSGATAALYWYTPHFHGNQNFYSIYSSWFGDPNSPCGNEANVTGAASGLQIMSYTSAGKPRLALTQQNNTGSSCAEIHLEAAGFQNWFSHTATGMKAADPTIGTLINSKAAIDRQSSLNYMVYSGAGGHVEVHRMSPDLSRFPGYYDASTDLTGITPSTGMFVAGDFFGRGYDQQLFIAYTGGGGHVELHMFDPSLRQAIGYYDISTDLVGITASAGTFVAGDFLGRGYDQLAFVSYSGAGGHVEVHLFDPTLRRAIGFYDMPSDLVGITASAGTFVAGDFLGRGYDQMAFVSYQGASGRVETHMFNPSLSKAIGFQDIITNITGFDPSN